MPASQPRVYADRAFDAITQWILPFGLLAFLCGMFVLPGRGPLQTLYYLFLALPTLVALLLRPRELLVALREPIVLLALGLAAWAVASIAWSDTTDSATSLAKRPLLMLLLFPALALIARHRLEALPALVKIAATVTTLFTAEFLVSYVAYPTVETRFVGGGAFDNPLLSAHLFGFFCTYWLYRCLSERNPFTFAWCAAGALITFAAVLATGSRTPLMALSLAVGWMALVNRDKRSVGLLLAGLVAGALTFLVFHQELMSRGSSYRFDIWKIVAGHIADHPWKGHGYDAELVVDVNVGYMLAEPHNFALGALYYLGIIGFIPWAGVQLVALRCGLQLRHQPLLVLGSTWLIFGISSGLTEGGGVFSP
ncbi:O-antigen ligase family protein [Pseudomonas sp. KNUC1026]|uniref:O-antigen ligase family protein n=1 Tax=Pseudomonas sp. KNUC1026 TaxID=2893890 RepID=UPI001F32DAC3|nr:O-antigen ligase family protein [Pseudomonas sp. KNUC1026]UFH49733.1 O-antigen ligase family protein [Pseudomonas sp. KNUC1026]